MAAQKAFTRSRGSAIVRSNTIVVVVGVCALDGRGGRILASGERGGEVLTAMQSGSLSRDVCGVIEKRGVTEEVHRVDVDRPRLIASCYRGIGKRGSLSTGQSPDSALHVVALVAPS